MTDNAVAVPWDVRVELLHAYVQQVADEADVDLLHVKGAAVSPEIQESPRGSIDVDVLVRPAHVARFLQSLYSRRWSVVSGFETGSAFQHAMNLRHDLGLLDIHRYWPGIEIPPEHAFDLMWEGRQTKELASIPCTVPGVVWQRLLLLLHFGRSGGQRQEDFDAVWASASTADREALRELARRTDAMIAFAAAVGEIDDYKGAPTYRLWRYFAAGRHGRFEEWLARWEAARTVAEKIGVLRQATSVNVDLLRDELHREPTRADLAQAYVVRLKRAGLDALSLARMVVGRERRNRG